MTCASKDGLIRTSMQTEPILPGGYGLLKVFRTVGEILEYAFALSQTCNRALQRRRERQRLLELDDRLLDDVGVTRAQAERTARKWFWQ